MKHLLLSLLVLAAMLPAARAHDSNPWETPKKILDRLTMRLDRAEGYRHRFGGNPHIKAEMADLRYGIRDLTYRVEQRAGDPKVARKKGEALSDMMADVESQYRGMGRERGVVIEVFH